MSEIFQKLEEKVMLVLSEIELLRKEILHLQHENKELKNEREKYLLDRANSEKKLDELISLFDAIRIPEPASTQNSLSVTKPILIQG